MIASRPDISVIIPHLNQPQQLAECLGSLKGQTLPPDRFEIIVVDNGSRESPATIIARFEGVRLEIEPVPGPGPARNRGAAASRGAILAFIDADCIAGKDWLKTIRGRFAEAEHRVMLGGDVAIGYVDPSRLTMLEAYESVFAYRQREYIEKHGFSGTGNLAVRREDFEAVGPFGGIDIAEDREWGRRAFGLGYRVLFVPEMIVYHPARKSMAELQAKWDRHILHAFEEWRERRFGRSRWTLLAIAVAISPLADARRVGMSRRIPSIRAKLLAILALFRIRQYRAIRMLRLALAARVSKGSVVWNR